MSPVLIIVATGVRHSDSPFYLSFSSLRTLMQMVSFKNNNMISIHPDSLQKQLRWLILTGNKISSIPNTIGRCCKLQKLMLSGNALSEIPKDIENCKNLELVRLACNQLQEVCMQQK